MKTDFLISPAYAVPPIRMRRSDMFTAITVSEFVPWRDGLAREPGAETMRNPAAASNAARRSRFVANRRCQASSVITRTGS